MRNAFLKARSGVVVFAVMAAFGMIFALSGCPISADNRDTYAGGPGYNFGQTGRQPSGSVTVFISGISPANNGSDAQVTLSTPNDEIDDQVADATVLGGTVTVNWQHVEFPRGVDYVVSLYISGFGNVGGTDASRRRIQVGDNVILLSELN